MQFNDQCTYLKCLNRATSRDSVPAIGCCVGYTVYLIVSSELCRMSKAVTLGLTDITANITRVTKEEKQINIFIRFLYLEGVIYRKPSSK